MGTIMIGTIGNERLWFDSRKLGYCRSFESWFCMGHGLPTVRELTKILTRTLKTGEGKNDVQESQKGNNDACAKLGMFSKNLIPGESHLCFFWAHDDVNKLSQFKS